MGLQGSTIGELIFPNTNGVGTGCGDFRPGFAFPPGEVIQCRNDHATDASACAITGVLAK
jgi:hypothetical protein